MKTYDDAVAFLYDRLPMFQNKGSSALKYKLDNILTFCKKLNHPQETYPIIHIAGTNGKGSVSHMLSSILQEAGFKTALYTSPHLKNFTERIKVNGKEMKPKVVLDFVNQYKHLTEEYNFSFFEWTVAMAFHEFMRQKVDIAIIEVGLGGRFDSTNIVNPILSVITNISKDHMHVLGNTLAEIAFEKAGIIKENTPVVIGEKHKETIEVFRKKAHEEHAPLYFAVQDKESLIACDLHGAYQQKNCRTAYKAIEVLNVTTGYHIPPHAIQQGLQNVVKNTGLKGRWQQLSSQPRMFCDTAHNESGVKEVMQQLVTLSHEQLWIVWGMVKDKDIDTILSLLPQEANYIFCEPNMPRKMTALELKEKAAALGLKGEIVQDVNQAITQAKNSATQKDVIYVGGSTFVVAEVKEL